MEHLFYLVLAYTKITIFLSLISLSGIIILHKTIQEKRAQIIFPAGVLVGIGIYLFLLNLTVHFLKGIPGFIVALLILICIAFWCWKKIHTKAIAYPTGKQRQLWITGFVIWTILLFSIMSRADINGADVTMYYSYASVFARGDYPIHTPWQPEYVAYSHIGVSELLGATRTLTGLSFQTIHALLAIIAFLCISQVLTFLLYKKNTKSIKVFLLASIPPLFAIISLGNIMLAIPVSLSFPLQYFISWLKIQPTLSESFMEVFGSPTHIDALIYFSHRFLSTALFIALIPIIISQGATKKKLALLLVLLATIALTDESVFFVILIPLFLIIWHTYFQKCFIPFLAYSFLIVTIVIFQGGIITESALHGKDQEQQILIFPQDNKQDQIPYRSYRLKQQETKIFELTQQYDPFQWIHPSIIILLIILILSYKIVLAHKNVNKEYKYIFWLFFFVSLIALLSYHSIIPKGLYHANGNRFLLFAYYIAGLGLSITLSLWWIRTKGKTVIKILLLWILITSILPAFLRLYPRTQPNWFLYNNPPVSKSFMWVKENIPVTDNILVLTENTPVLSSTIALVREVGAFTPIWESKPQVHDVFDVGPTYADIFYTVNPTLLKTLNIKYLIINDTYLTTLPKERKQDLANKTYFTPVFTDADTKIVKLNPAFFNYGKDLDGTLTQLKTKAPISGSYYIDYPPNITEHMFRALRLLFNERESYFNKAGSFYNGRIDINVRNGGFKLDGKYDYLILGENVDPETICRCEATLLWTGFGNGVKLWTTKKNAPSLL